MTFISMNFENTFISERSHRTVIFIWPVTGGKLKVKPKSNPISCSGGPEYSWSSYNLNQYRIVINWTGGNKFQWNLNQNTMIMIEKMHFENGVCTIVAVSSQCVDIYLPRKINTVPPPLDWLSGIILCMRPVNERRRYTVTPSLIGWAHTQNYP